MRDPFSWSFPLGRLFGVTVRVHILFPFVTLGLILQVAFRKAPEGYVYPPGAWVDVAIASLLLLMRFA